MLRAPQAASQNYSLLSKMPASSEANTSIRYKSPPKRNLDTSRTTQSSIPLELNASKLLSVHKQQLDSQQTYAKSKGTPVSSEWIYSQREKRDKLRERNMVYLDKLKHMISVRDSRIENKLKGLQMSEQLRQEKARKASLDRELKAKLKKEENQLRNVYFSLQKSRQLEEEQRKISQWKRALNLPQVPEQRFNQQRKTEIRRAGALVMRSAERPNQYPKT